jgi:hypothetical protein
MEMEMDEVEGIAFAVCGILYLTVARSFRN